MRRGETELPEYVVKLSRRGDENIGNNHAINALTSALMDTVKRYQLDPETLSPLFGIGGMETRDGCFSITLTPNRPINTNAPLIIKNIIETAAATALKKHPVEALSPEEQGEDLLSALGIAATIKSEISGPSRSV